jgi:hypothetical protein
MKTIWKFSIPASDSFVNIMPKGSTIIHVEAQFNNPYMWAEVDSGAELVEREFEIFATGQTIPDRDGVNRLHCGSFLMDNGSLVFHLYEVIHITYLV